MDEVDRQAMRDAGRGEHEPLSSAMARARRAQQENEQRHDVQLEIQHDEFCWIACPHSEPPNEIYGPGPDCHPED